MLPRLWSAFLLAVLFLPGVTAQTPIATEDTDLSWTVNNSVPWVTIPTRFATPSFSDTPLIVYLEAGVPTVAILEEGSWNDYVVDAAFTNAISVAVEAFTGSTYLLGVYPNTDAVTPYLSTNGGENWTVAGNDASRGSAQRHWGDRPELFSSSNYAFVFFEGLYSFTEDGATSWTTAACDLNQVAPTTSASHVFMYGPLGGPFSIASGITETRVSLRSLPCLGTDDDFQIYDTGAPSNQGMFSYGGNGVVWQSDNDADDGTMLLYHPLDENPPGIGGTQVIAQDITASILAGFQAGNLIGEAYWDGSNNLHFLYSVDGGSSWKDSVVGDVGVSPGTISVGWADDAIWIYGSGFVATTGISIEGEETGGVPAEFDAGLIGFAASAGFISQESQLLFALILIGLATVTTSASSKWMAPGAFKNYVLMAVQILVAVFCVVLAFLDLWMFLVAFMLALFAVRGGSEIRNTFFQIRQSLQDQNERVGEDIGPTQVMEIQVDEERQEAVEQAFQRLEDQSAATDTGEVAKGPVEAVSDDPGGDS